jgi:4-hydroxybenzoate polyprenyltransferase
LALGISPLATWIAITGTVSPFPALLGAGVFFWVAGFDLIYSCQDYDFDKTHDLKNLVVKTGVAKALTFSKIAHVLCLTFFLLAGLNLNLGTFYTIGLIVMAGFLIYEHRLVSPTDLSRVDLAFFTLNGYVAVSFFVFSLLEIYL